MHTASEVLWSFQSALDKRLVDDHLRGHIRQFTSLPGLRLLSHGLEVSLHSIHAHPPTEIQSMSKNDFECLASTGVNTPVTM